MVVIQASVNTNGIKADLKRGPGGVPGALTPNPAKLELMNG